MATATYDLIASQTLGSAASSITFSSIAASWTDLRLVLTYQGSAALLPAFRFNSDTASNYSITSLYGDGSSAASNKAVSQTILDDANSYSTVGQPGLTNVNIFSYAGSTYKTILMQSSSDHNGSGYVSNSVGLWRSTSAITTITITDYSGLSFGSGTTANLYGIRAA